MTDLGWQDGFTEYVPEKFCHLFSPSDWARSEADERTNLLMHLHGSVRFGHRPQETLMDVTTRFGEPARFDQIVAAQQSVENTTVSGTNVDGDVADASYIISGSRKAGKLAYNARPYGYYYATAMNLVPKASNLLMLGYGWRDVHINTWINEYVALHSNRRTAVVTYRSGAVVGRFELPEHAGLARLAGTAVWRRLESWAWARWPDQSAEPSRFMVEGRFAIAPEGFVMTREDESRLLEFMLAS